MGKITIFNFSTETKIVEDSDLALFFQETTKIKKKLSETKYLIFGLWSNPPKGCYYPSDILVNCKIMKFEVRLQNGFDSIIPYRMCHT